MRRREPAEKAIRCPDCGIVNYYDAGRRAPKLQNIACWVCRYHFKSSDARRKVCRALPSD